MNIKFFINEHIIKKEETFSFIIKINIYQILLYNNLIFFYIINVIIILLINKIILNYY